MTSFSHPTLSTFNKGSRMSYRGMSLMEFVLVTGNFPTHGHYIVNSLLREGLIHRESETSSNATKANTEMATIPPNAIFGNTISFSVPKPPICDIDALLNWEKEIVRYLVRNGINTAEAAYELLQLIVPIEYPSTLTFEGSTEDILRRYVHAQTMKTSYYSQASPAQGAFTTIRRYYNAVERWTRRYRNNIRDDPMACSRFREVFLAGIAPMTQFKLQEKEMKLEDVESVLAYLLQWDEGALCVLHRTLKHDDYGDIPTERSQDPESEAKQSRTSRTTNRPRFNQNESTKPSKPKQYCDYHKSTTHSTADCRAQQQHGDASKRRKRQ
ncbi:hypothetical protein NEHOM01_1644 [Nematocida homosporus]|uniref:uncharacterized protein n=1 Tax=Nematocida homosporus TaxID=1912981 RepID=UPI00221FB1F6|nr:uncharacterized protein NEHOM01_1644 [Nematocida homosporus]KAI5186705.1 hypothetical protein NEHOM01_1644 [Nematocida homosporus]